MTGQRIGEPRLSLRLLEDLDDRVFFENLTGHLRVLLEQRPDLAEVEVAQGEGVGLDVEGAGAPLSLRVVANGGFVITDVAHPDEGDAVGKGGWSGAVAITELP